MPTTTIAPGLQHTPPADGFAHRTYLGFNSITAGTSTAGTVASTAQTFEVRGDTTYANAYTETSTLLVPALRPFASAALHTVGSDFMAITASNMTKVTIRRFF